jgi:hypothetical protein
MPSVVSGKRHCDGRGACEANAVSSWIASRTQCCIGYGMTMSSSRRSRIKAGGPDTGVTESSPFDSLRSLRAGCTASRSRFHLRTSAQSADGCFLSADECRVAREGSRFWAVEASRRLRRRGSCITATRRKSLHTREMTAASWRLRALSDPEKREVLSNLLRGLRGHRLSRGR